MGSFQFKMVARASFLLPVRDFMFLLIINSEKADRESDSK